MKNFIFKITTILFFPNVIFASQEAGHHGIESLTWYYVNSFIFFAVLFFFLRKPMKKAFQDRKTSVFNNINEAAKIFNDAQKELQIAQKKHECLDEELGKIKDGILAEAEEQAKSIINIANKKATYLKDSARQMILAEEQKALKNLSKEFGEMLIQSATKDIKESLNADVDKKLIERGIDSAEKFLN